MNFVCALPKKRETILSVMLWLWMKLTHQKRVDGWMFVEIFIGSWVDKKLFHCPNLTCGVRLDGDAKWSL